MQLVIPITFIFLLFQLNTQEIQQGKVLFCLNIKWSLMVGCRQDLHGKYSLLKELLWLSRGLRSIIFLNVGRRIK